MKKKTSLADIAASLNVSKTLVSMVLNGRGEENGISKDTREKVLAKAKELNYRPNMLARGLRLGKTHTVGLIVSDISNPFYAKIIRAVEDALNVYNYNLIVCSSDEDLEKERNLIQMLEYKQVDGMIISTSSPGGDDFTSSISTEIPFVLVDRYLSDIQTHYVCTDNFSGAKDLTAHLLDQGYRDIVVLSHHPLHLSSLHDRKKGIKKAYEEFSLEFKDSNLVDVPFNDRYAYVFKEMERLLQKGKPDAVFCLNNSLSIAFLDYCKQKGIKIPEDIAFASYDEIDLFRLLPVPVTSVMQPVEGIGQKAVDLLFTQINNSEVIPFQELQLEPTLNIRASSKKNL